MAQDSSGAKNQPIFAETGAPQIGTDLSLVSNYAATVGNRKAGTTAERTALSGADRWEGLSYYDTTLDEEFVWDGSAWFQKYNGRFWLDGSTVLPDPQTAVTGLVHTITSTSTSFATLPTSECKITLTLSAQAWVTCTGGAWMVTSSGSDVRMGIKVTGATTSLPNEPAWGCVMRADIGQDTMTGSVTKTILMNAGVNTIYLAAYRSTASGTQTVSYPYLEVVPLRYN